MIGNPYMKELVIASIEDVRTALAFISTIATDDEAAHAAEDAMRSKVLELVASGHPEAIALAKLALRSSAIKFGRWCA